MTNQEEKTPKARLGLNIGGKLARLARYVLAAVMPVPNGEKDAAANLSDEDKVALGEAIAWNLLVKWAVAVFVLFCYVAILINYQSKESVDYRPVWLVIVPISIMLSSVVGLRYVTPGVPRGAFALSSGFELRAGVTEFPLALLFFDFLNLGVLVAATGRLESVFLPLFVVALLLGDISTREEKRNPSRCLFGVAVLCGVLLPEIDPIRYLLINHGQRTSRESLWVLPDWATIAFGLTLFFAGAFFGSLVLRWYKDRPGRNKLGGDAAKAALQ